MPDPIIQEHPYFVLLLIFWERKSGSQSKERSGEVSSGAFADGKAP